MNSKIGLPIIMAFALVLLVSGCTQAQNTESDAMENVMDNGAPQGDAMEDDSMMEIENTITYSDDGFSPSPLTIKVGESVIWINNSSIDMWPASAMHPIHTAYPGSDIKKCGSTQESLLFDACKGISPGNTYSFIFNEAGEWFYHDHLTSGNFGQVIVKS
ncbi:MAG: hypothetical protein ABIH20_04780 [Candidatus Diapherotrites archaeon]